ncbi:MAG: response regulator [Desulfobulbaceae bacterium]|jgi:DNA-binding response OmpR family regulator|nr:response regulator [Desulfobulbaceae bacterium]
MKTILIVDDEESIRVLYQAEFEDDGYRVLLAENGEKAIRFFWDDKPDLVILDIQMPGMNGLEVLRQMKTIDAAVPVILCTAYPNYMEDISCWASDDYIIKSGNLTTLKAAASKYLGE